MTISASAEPTTAFWSGPEHDLFAALETTVSGLTDTEADRRRAQRTGGGIEPARLSDWRLAFRQIENPIVLLLLGATLVSMALGEVVDGLIIVVITGASVGLGFMQERGAVRVVDDLLAAVRVAADVLRGGTPRSVRLGDVVVGDVVVLRAGSVIPGDGRVLSSDALLLDESALTGESYPVAKEPGTVDAGSAQRLRSNSVWCGTHVASGTGTALIAAVGSDTEFGKVAEQLTKAHVPTAFELGLRQFGFLVMKATAVLVVAILIINIALGRPVVEALLFSLALAVGLTPQLLPAIVTVTLSHGAREMARRKVIVKRLDAIEDIGAIDVLCTDKTGTLTSGVVRLDRAVDPCGVPSARVAELASMNATLQQGFVNPIDEAIKLATPVPTAGRLIDELPYDFSRRLLSVLVADENGATLITKGAVDSVLARCDLGDQARAAAHVRFADLSAEGFRVLGVATRRFDRTWPERLTSSHESCLELAGFLCFADPPKADAAVAVAELAAAGVLTKLITGDNRYAARHAAEAVGLDASTIVTGEDVAFLNDEELQLIAAHTQVFAEIEPLQKERIVMALRRSGRSVGYLGDGINDAPSLRAADVGISVDTAVDIAKHSASIVLLDKDLGVLADGIRAGRRVFANTLKYVQVTLSANFGNMVSMAAAAAFLPFLPLLPLQILLLNFLSDIPGTTIAADRVDDELVADPHGWDIRRIRSFMITFGLVSSVFDIGTFVLLRLVFHADASLFRTGWFIESTATELAVMLVLRTRRAFYRSRPGTALLAASAAIAVITVALPFSPLAGDLGLIRPSPSLLVALVGVTAGYVVVTEIVKRKHGSRLAAR
jgi:P-type Mg2+ transporter